MHYTRTRGIQNSACSRLKARAEGVWHPGPGDLAPRLADLPSQCKAGYRIQAALRHLDFPATAVVGQKHF
jgi:hypothetical protein